MSPSTRLRLVAVVLLLSAVYAVLIAQDRDLAQAVAVAYISILLTIIFLISFWKRDA